MTIDIITAAQADRKAKLDQILALQLDVIEIDAFIAKARAYAGEGEEREERVLVVPDPKPLPDGGERLRGHAADYANADKVVTESGRVLKDKFAGESTTPEPSNAGASEAKSDDLSTTPSNPKIPTIPLATEGEESVAVPEINPTPIKAGTKYGQILEALRRNPQANPRALAKLTGATLGTARAYATRAREEIANEQAQQAGEMPQEARKPDPAPKAEPAPKPQPAPPAPAPRHVSTRPMAEQPKNTMFRLRNAEGLYLAADLNAMLKVGLRFVTKTNYPWQGSERQMAAVRKMLPETVNLREEVIQ